ncbi:ectoine/hydroxyectoine ABC transporter permease subunit EhuD [Aneurinibacillus tyrosinisolvens]|uniref:ectoine/hydroxyectoine ABC transporter permease subunit EhuD n=1 Tax=Aneurinibacillus tyrosinisolvens TaxID=1443435 RepID=UPI00063FAF9B|nr:ectoine/hydroxyectoine ABC transporter permease subunit EhuD [Aneurinibacillus tyrosinisolvens]
MWNWDFAISIMPELLQVIWITITATIFGFFIAAILGLFLAFGRRSKRKWLGNIFAAVIEFVRSTPLLIQLYFLYFVLPLYGIKLSAFTLGVLGLGIHYSTYLSEVYRAGIDGVPRGQWEAAIALNFTNAQKWRRIILPQAIRPVIPVLGNYLIVMFKETPLLSTISVVELMQTAKLIGSESFRYLEAFTIVGLLFFMLSYLSSFFVRWLDLRLNHK